MVCDLTIAADNAVFGQTGPKVNLALYISDCLCIVNDLSCSCNNYNYLWRWKIENLLNFYWKILICIECKNISRAKKLPWFLLIIIIQHVLCKLQVGSFDAGFGASIMSRLVSFLKLFRDLQWPPDSLLQLWVVDWIGWAKTSAWNVVYGEVLQRCRSRENGTCQYCCSCKNTKFSLLLK